MKPLRIDTGTITITDPRQSQLKKKLELRHKDVSDCNEDLPRANQECWIFNGSLI